MLSWKIVIYFTVIFIWFAPTKAYVEVQSSMLWYWEVGSLKSNSIMEASFIMRRLEINGVVITEGASYFESLF